MLNFEELVKAIFKASQSFVDAWLFKAVMALTITGITSAHGSALLWFVVLVFIDLVTRWNAITYKYLQDCQKDSDLLSCIISMPAAWKAGYINSSAMKHRFGGKIIFYIFITMMAVSADNMLQLAGETPLLLKLAWVYLAATEAISVLENLRDAGIERASVLLDFLRSRLSVLFERFKTK